MSVCSENAQAACALISALGARVRHAIVSPGSRNTPIVLALEAAEHIETHVVLDERTAGFMALGLSRSTGCPVILSCTSGSAGAHYLPAIIEAFENRTPIVAITADRPAELHGYAAAQTTHQTALFGSHTLAQLTLPLPDEVQTAEFARLGTELLNTAADGPGPVHVNAPFREPLWSLEAHYTVGPVADETLRDSQLLKEASEWVDALRDAERGLIVVGPRARQDQLATEREFSTAVHRLATKLSWPILADITSGVRFDEASGATVITGFDAMLRSEATRHRFKPEHVLSLGRPPTSKSLNQWLASEKIPSTFIGERIHARDPGLHVVQAIAATPTTAVEAAAAQLSKREATPWQNQWKQAELAFQDELETLTDWWEGSIAHALVAQLPAGSLLLGASSMPIRDLDTFSGPLRRPITITANRGVNGIDGLVATTVGHALGWSRGPAALLVGDLALLHDLGSIQQAARVDAPMTIVVVNNGGGRIFDFLPISTHPTAFRPFFLTPQKADFAAISRAFGARHETVHDLSGLRSALGMALERAGLDVIEAVVDGQHNRPAHEAFFDALSTRLT